VASFGLVFFTKVGVGRGHAEGAVEAIVQELYLGVDDCERAVASFVFLFGVHDEGI
jgi:hypothetical protein